MQLTKDCKNIKAPHLVRCFSCIHEVCACSVYSMEKRDRGSKHTNYVMTMIIHLGTSSECYHKTLIKLGTHLARCSSFSSPWYSVHIQTAAQAVRPRRHSFMQELADLHDRHPFPYQIPNSYKNIAHDLQSFPYIGC